MWEICFSSFASSLLLLIWIVIDCLTTKDIATNEVITYNIKDSIDVSFIYDLSGSLSVMEVMIMNISDTLVIDFNSLYEKANNYYELTGEMLL